MASSYSSYSSYSSSSYAPIRPQEKYDVFVSFRGVDTRDTFTSHLYAALHRKKVHTFIDDRLERGDEISPALEKVIKEARLSLIIFSENYASSTWCLEELVQILECREKGQITIPVFYRVDPSHVRKHKGNYAAAFTELEERFKNRMDKVRQWRAALTEASNLSGWDSLVTKPESKLIEGIVEDILKKLNYKLSTSEVKGLVGMKERIKKIESLLCMGSPDVRVIGIWGMGGIGKTTLAGAVFNRFSYQFESCYFLANVREELEKHGLHHLRHKLISALLDEKEIDMGSPFVELTYIKERLLKKRVFIVVDDVDHFSQLETLVGDLDQFGDKSRIIVTTRDVQVLRKVANCQVYNVEGLEFSDAYNLLRANAFREKSSIPDGYRTLSKRVIYYAKGVPLALKVLGSLLHSKSTKEWESAMDKLERVPNMDIQDVLRISYDGLDDNQKDIFLDIACFFKGYAVGFVERILDGCGFFPSIGISVLVDKSLIYKDKDDTLQMHDLLQEMGREIVRQESIKEPGERSRLWNINDSYQVLKRNSGTAKVEGLFLNTSEIKEVELMREVFSKMYNLRLLKIYGFEKKNKCKLKFPQDLHDLPDALAYLCWDGFPLKFLPSNFTPENIVILKLRYSQLKQLWDGVQDLGKLREMDFSYSKHLTHIPDLSHATNLETLNLEYCTSLLQLPELSRSIKTLYVEGCAIKKMRSSMGSVDELESFDPGNRKDLVNLPSSTCNLKSVTVLINIFGCTSIIVFPSLPNSVRRLDLSETSIKAVPSSVELLSDLSSCCLKDCTMLESLPTSICKLKSLTSLDLSGCSKLESFPEIMEPMQLDSLNLVGSGIRELHSSIGNLSRLTSLNLDMCENLEVLPSSIYKLQGIPRLFIFGCPKLEKLPPLYIKLFEDINATHASSSFISWGVGEDLKQEITFLNCPKLNLEACLGIMAETHMRFLHMKSICASISLCCPGNEIPKWFTYHSHGSSVNIHLPPNWSGSNFLGLALCVVVEFHNFVAESVLKIMCNASFKSDSAEEVGFLWTLKNWGMDKYEESRRVVNSDHVFLWYDHGILKDLEATNMNCCSSASFSFKRFSFSTIKKCGVSLLYAQDADTFDQYVREAMVEDATKRHQDEYEFEFEASGSEIVISSDIEEEEHNEPNPLSLFGAS